MNEFNFNVGVAAELEAATKEGIARATESYNENRGDLPEIALTRNQTGLALAASLSNLNLSEDPLHLAFLGDIDAFYQSLRHFTCHNESLPDVWTLLKPYDREFNIEDGSPESLTLMTRTDDNRTKEYFDPDAPPGSGIRIGTPYPQLLNLWAARHYNNYEFPVTGANLSFPGQSPVEIAAVPNVCLVQMLVENRINAAAVLMMPGQSGLRDRGITLHEPPLLVSKPGLWTRTQRFLAPPEEHRSADKPLEYYQRVNQQTFALLPKVAGRLYDYLTREGLSLSRDIVMPDFLTRKNEAVGS